MLSRITAVIMAIVSFISGFGPLLTTESEVLYDVEYGKYKRQLVDVVFPAEYEQEQGIILYIHGGGWISGKKTSFTKRAITASKKYNCITASLNYRFASDKVDCNDILDDIDKALSKIRTLAEMRGIKADKVMLVGYSAGAHLSLLYAYTRKETASVKPVAVVSYSGPADLTSDEFISYNAFGDEDFMLEIVSDLIGENVTSSNFSKKKSKILKISPVSYVSPFCVPTLVVQGRKDAIVPVEDTRAFVEKLGQYGVVHEYFEFRNSGHKLNSDPLDFAQSEVVFESYVNEYLKQNNSLLIISA